MMIFRDKDRLCNPPGGNFTNLYFLIYVHLSIIRTVLYTLLAFISCINLNTVRLISGGSRRHAGWNILFPSSCVAAVG